MLAVAARRRLLLFHWDGAKCTELKELGLPDVAKTLAWAGDAALCVGMRKEYSMVDTKSGALTELCPTGYVAHPVAVALGSDELLLHREGAGVFYSPAGKQSRKLGMTFSEPPSHLLLSSAYALALLPNKHLVEIRSLERTSQHELVQVIPVPADAKAVCLGGDGSAVLASAAGGRIVRLTPVPIIDQIYELADKEDFQEALNLCALLPEQDVGTGEDRASVEDELHVRFGKYLYRRLEFEDALAHLGMCRRPSPLHLLQLFPALLPETPAARKRAGQLLDQASMLDDGEDPAASLSDAERQMAWSEVLPYLMSHRGRLAASRAHEGGPDPPQLDASRELLAMLVDTAICKVMLRMNDTGALLAFVQRSNGIDLTEGEHDLQAAGRYAELVALYEANGCHRKALEMLAKLSQSPDSLPVPPQGAAAELVGLPGVWAAVRYAVRLGADHASLVLEFSTWILTADPENGLEMFLEMKPPLPPAKVLAHLRAEAPSMCAPYLEAALERGAASPKDYHSELVLIYLQDALEEEDASAGGAAREGGGDSNGKGKRALIPQDKEHRAARLQALICTSQHLSLDRILVWLPAGSLPGVRALLLQRLGRTKQVLHLFAKGMGEPALAEEYCDFLYDFYAEAHRRRPPAGPPADIDHGARAVPSKTNPDVVLCLPGAAAGPAAGGRPGGAPEQPDVYLHLLQIILDTEHHPTRAGAPTAPDITAAVAQLLCRKQHRINPIVALSLLPGDMPVGRVAAFLEGAMRGMREERHNTAIVKNLRRSENLQVREELVRCRQRRVVVSNERACAICHKRIGGSVFAAYPDNTLVHFVCYKRSLESGGGTR